MLSKMAPSAIFWIVGMTRTEIEPRSSRPLVNTLQSVFFFRTKTGRCEQMLHYCVWTKIAKNKDRMNKWKGVPWKGKCQTRGSRKNTTHFISVFQPLSGPISNLGDVKGYFLSWCSINCSPPPKSEDGGVTGSEI